MPRLATVARRLVEAYPEAAARWWPVDSEYHRNNGSDPRFEIIVGAILTQNTAWTNVEKALAGLRRAQAFEVRSLAAMSRSRLETAIRPAGYFRQKAGYLQGVARALRDDWDANLDAFLGRPWPTVRSDLLAMRGIGPETADDILVYAADAPSFIVDAYTRRLMRRLGRPEADASYATVQMAWTTAVGTDAAEHGRVHGAIVEHAKQRCRARDPVCNGCPLTRVCMKVGVAAKA